MVSVLAFKMMDYGDFISKNQPILYTFGSPRAGNGGFAAAVNTLFKDNYRVIRNRDPVAHLPRCGKVCIYYNNYHYKQDIYVFGKCINSTKTGEFYPYHPVYEMWFDSAMTNYRMCKGLPYGEDMSCSDGLMMPFIVDDHLYYFGLRVGHGCMMRALTTRETEIENKLRKTTVSNLF